MRPIEVVIFAGGVGRRMIGSKRPKQFLELSGRPIIDYTIACFARNSHVTRIVVSCLESWIPYLEEWLSTCSYKTPIDIVPGGDCGQQSIFNGVSYLRNLHPGNRDAVVLIHDGVRPLISQEAIDACIDSVITRGPTATVAPSTETVVVQDSQGTISSVLYRGDCVLARAPQGFMLEDLYAAHLKAQEEGKRDFVDSISLMAHYGHKIFVVEGPAENIKVTTPMDYYAFKGYMEARDQESLWGESM